ncbi:GMC family oxidoreductase N-terminal domain-containing protein [Qipengyuania sp. S6317L1]|uniref:GMC family oxidoreductase N-terminal domain-containing protein n=1 Tax=Qipengyuania sp. S6317L1 TaxID=2926410 RepID=UPI001FF67BB6|nr:GMC family oxidoreductase N-terminal domain-containing protein [Qipengyuania sp. S6317L1]MCK0100289.1 GMC family oxidoreductase N-terminal domain-containing protein [Qipengyuania sp. S6317L1]
MSIQQTPFGQKRIAKSLDQAKSHYTVLVVGSGYGAGVAASRLARAGQDVCVLERGKEMLPGEYPNKIGDAQDAVQFNVKGGRIGAPDALFEVHVNDDQYALVGCGLGGTSLINANVSLELDKRLLDQAHWPSAFRDDPHMVDAYYERAREMLSPNAYPDTHPTLGKLEALEHSAKTMGERFYKTPINVNFEDKTNKFGVPQPACNNCGDCVSGCNVGAKNTTLMNYLPDAANHGAEIYTQAKVSHVERVGDKWLVHVDNNDGGEDKARVVISADHVVLGAGALGSTEILLRSREKGLPLSDRLGASFSGNGDALGFAYDSYFKSEKTGEEVHAEPFYAIGVGANDVAKEAYPGPCITGVIDMRGHEDVTKGLVIEEGVAPGILAAGLGPAFFFGEALADGFTRFGFDQIKPRLMDAKAMGEAVQTDPASIASLAYKGPMARTLTYLVMSVDDSGGQLKLEDDRLTIEWKSAGKQRTFRRDDDKMREAAEAIQAQYFSDPLWSEPMGQKLITVHPIGGCAMGDDAGSGVVDDTCRVFSGTSDTDVHEGLYVCDGSVLPGAVGVNPLLTITAVSERAIEKLAQRQGWEIDYSFQNEGPLPEPIEVKEAAEETQEVPHNEHVKLSIAKWVAGHAIGPVADSVVAAAEHFRSGAVEEGKAAIRKLVQEHPEAMSPGMDFTETMAGYISATGCHHRPCGHAERIRDDYENGSAWGQSEKSMCSFKLTVATDNLHRMIEDKNHRSRITGEVLITCVSPQPLKVREGQFQLLVTNPDRAESWTMNYFMVLEGPEGPIHFQGHKTLEQRGKSDPWTDLTTLFVTVRHGDEDGELIGRGVLKLGIDEFMRQLTTITVHDSDTLVGHVVNLIPKARKAIETYFMAKYAGFFAMNVFRAYGGMLATLNDFPTKDAEKLVLRELHLPKAERYVVPAEDGVNVGLTRYRGGSRGPIMLAPGFSVKASSFATPTVKKNLAESLVEEGYDVWLFDYRASADSGNDREKPPEFSIDDIARYDWPAAIAKVRSVSGADSVQALAHCVGSMSLLMGIGAGWVSDVRSLISSQLTLHPVTDWLNYMKSDLGIAGALGEVSLLDGHMDFVSQGTDADNEIDAVMYQVPMPEGQECKSPTVRRVFGVFGPSWDVRQLGHDTYLALGSMFSRVSLSPFEQLQNIMRKGLALNANGEDIYTSEDAARRLALPITFLSGATNQIFYPESGQRTRVWLSGHNGKRLYSQRIVPDYGHMDLFIGRNASKEVTPLILKELQELDQKTSQGQARKRA